MVVDLVFSFLVYLLLPFLKFWFELLEPAQPFFVPASPSVKFPGSCLPCEPEEWSWANLFSVICSCVCSWNDITGLTVLRDTSRKLLQSTFWLEAMWANTNIVFVFFHFLFVSWFFVYFLSSLEYSFFV